ncbi:MAG: hypothetical protein IPG22_07455 [Acidobacteria bacterium]|nr:hypothetical protein [Acidobacteriota bacterium]
MSLIDKKEAFAELVKSGRSGYSVIDTALDKIAGLEQQLAERDAKIVRLEEQAARLLHGLAKCGEARDCLKQQLAANDAALYNTARKAARIAMEKCKNATGQRRKIEMYVSANQIAEDVLDAINNGLEKLAHQRKSGNSIVRLWNTVLQSCLRNLQLLITRC